MRAVLQEIIAEYKRCKDFRYVIWSSMFVFATGAAILVFLALDL